MLTLSLVAPYGSGKQPCSEGFHALKRVKDVGDMKTWGSYIDIDKD